MSVSPVRAEHDIFDPQVGTDSNSDGFLPNIGVASAMNQAPLMRPGKLLLALPDQPHPAVEAQGRFPVNGRQGAYSKGVRAERRPALIRLMIAAPAA